MVMETGKDEAFQIWRLCVAPDCWLVTSKPPPFSPLKLTIFLSNKRFLIYKFVKNRLIIVVSLIKKY